MKKPLWKRALRYSLYTLLAIIGPISLYFLMACMLSNIGTSPKELACDKAYTAYLSDNGVHIDIILPMAAMDTNFLAKLGPKATTKYLAIGWGDRGFYLNTPTWDDVRMSTVCYALLWNSPSVMHISEYNNAYEGWTAMSLCKEQVDAMTDKMQKSFKMNEDESFQRIKNYAYGQNDYFCEAKGSYNCFNTCNVWTGRMLKAGQVKTAVWSPFTGGIMGFAEQNKP